MGIGHRKKVSINILSNLLDYCINNYKNKIQKRENAAMFCRLCVKWEPISVCFSYSNLIWYKQTDTLFIWLFWLPFMRERKKSNNIQQMIMRSLSSVNCTTQTHLTGIKKLLPLALKGVPGFEPVNPVIPNW